jgi:hypothetical protein
MKKAFIFTVLLFVSCSIAHSNSFIGKWVAGFNTGGIGGVIPCYMYFEFYPNHTVEIEPIDELYPRDPYMHEMMGKTGEVVREFDSASYQYDEYFISFNFDENNTFYLPDNDEKCRYLFLNKDSFVLWSYALGYEGALVLERIK